MVTAIVCLPTKLLCPPLPLHPADKRRQAGRQLHFRFTADELADREKKYKAERASECCRGKDRTSKLALVTNVISGGIGRSVGALFPLLPFLDRGKP